MDFYFLFLILLALWPPLLWPALRTKGRLRLWLLLMVALGLAVSLYEARNWFAPAEPIRVDILLGAPFLAGLFAVTAVLLFLAKWRRFAAVYGLAIALLLGASAFAWWEIEREQARYVEGRALVAQAGFRSRETYERRFGPFAPAVQDLPVGHWQPEDEAVASRLIINGEGRLWLFRSHLGVETLDLTSGAEVLRREAAEGTTWTAELMTYGVSHAPMAVAVTRRDAGHLTLSLRGSSANFTRTPPPIESEPSRQDLRNLGSFAAVDCDGRRLDLAQLWLWRDEVRLYAVGVARAFSPSQPASFARPMVLGAAEERNGVWHFAWDGLRGDSEAELILGEGRVEMTIRQGTWPERQLRLIRGRGFLAGDMVDLAPLSTAEAWRHWFSVVPLGNRVIGATPAC